MSVDNHDDILMRKFFVERMQCPRSVLFEYPGMQSIWEQEMHPSALPAS